MNACDSVSGCVVVSWVYGTPGSCYFKGAANAPSYNDHVWGARQLLPCASTAASSAPPSYATAKLKLHRKRVVRSPFAKLDKKTSAAKTYNGPDYTFGPLSSGAKATKTATKTATATATV